MDTQKLHDLIDKVIGKKGPLRVPAYWMNNLMNELISYIENIATSLCASFSKGLNSKLDCLKSLTYQEFYEAHIKNQLVEGATYHIKDYKPVLSVRETRWPITKYPPEYDLYIIYSRNIFRYESEAGGVSFFDDSVFDGYVVLRKSHGGGCKYRIKYVTHDCAHNQHKWVPNISEWIQEMTVSISTESGGIKKLNLLFTIDENNQSYYVDKNTNETYTVQGISTISNEVSLAAPDSSYVSGNIIKYSLRTYGTIIKMQDELSKLDVCYDFLGIESPFKISGISNVTISGYPSGYLPRISLECSGKNITFINSTDIEVDIHSELNDTVFVNSYRIKIDDSDVSTTRFVDSADINISEDSVVRNVEFLNSTKINCNCGYRDYPMVNCCVFSSNNIDLLGRIYDCNICNCYYTKIQSCIKLYVYKCWYVHINSTSYSAIYDRGEPGNIKTISGDNLSVCGNKLSNLLVLRGGVVGYYSDSKMNKINIPTISSVVTDESSGKTIDVIIQELQDKIAALEGRV